jgi:hypothetical protein
MCRRARLNNLVYWLTTIGGFFNSEQLLNSLIMCRRARLNNLVYWLTTTSITTSTSTFYTSTISFISANCTPTFWPWAACG